MKCRYCEHIRKITLDKICAVSINTQLSKEIYTHTHQFPMPHARDKMDDGKGYLGRTLKLICQSNPKVRYTIIYNLTVWTKSESSY